MQGTTHLYAEDMKHYNITMFITMNTAGFMDVQQNFLQLFFSPSASVDSAPSL